MADVNIRLSSRPQDTLYFTGSFGASDLGLQIDVAMTNVRLLAGWLCCMY
jgi:hypothetical protein